MASLRQPGHSNLMPHVIRLEVDLPEVTPRSWLLFLHYQAQQAVVNVGTQLFPPLISALSYASIAYEVTLQPLHLLNNHRFTFCGRMHFLCQFECTGMNGDGSVEKHLWLAVRC